MQTLKDFKDENSEKLNFQNENLKKGKNLNKMKALFITSIAIIIISIVIIIVVLSLNAQFSKKYKKEISVLIEEKRELENKNLKLNEEINNLTNKLNKVENDDIMINKTYKTLQDISKEVVS